MTDKHNTKHVSTTEPTNKTGKSWIDQILVIDVILMALFLGLVGHCTHIMVTYW